MSIDLAVHMRRGTFSIQLHGERWELARVNIDRAWALLIGPIRVEWYSARWQFMIASSLFVLALLATPTQTIEQRLDRDLAQHAAVWKQLEGTPYDTRPSLAFRALGWATVATASTDLLSTQYVLSAGGYERNPLATKGIKGMIVGKAAATVAILYATEHLRKTDHEKAALWIRIATVAVWGYATAHNLRVGQELRGK